MKTFHPSISLLALSVLSACSSLADKHDAETRKARERLDELSRYQRPQSPFNEQTPSTAPPVAPLAIRPLSKPQQDALEKKWLTDIQHITLDPAKNAAVSATAIIRMLRAKGINIISHVPLDLYSYNGFGVTDVNAETALMVFLGAMGLDYELDHTHKLVVIRPLKSKTWQLDIGNRRTRFNAGDENSASGTNTPTAGLPGALGPSGTTPGYAGTMPGAIANQGLNNASTGASTAANATGSSNTITAVDNVWDSLRTELTQRLTIPFPKTSSTATAETGVRVPGMSNPQPPIATPMPGAVPGGMNMAGQAPHYYNLLQVGTVAINPETGAVTVQAPRYLMDTLDTYMNNVIRRYNTLITIEAEILSLTDTENRSEGLDWTSFNTANNGSQTFVAQNSILGGAIITPAAGTKSVADALSIASSAIPGSHALLGLVSSSKKFAAINAYLSSVGELRIKDTPIIVTTSGSPVKLNNTTIRYYQQYTQQVAAGATGSAATAVNTIDVPYETGITIRVNPTYNVETGVINCLFSIDRKSQQGWQEKVNPIVTGTSVQSLTTKTPIINITNQNGNLVLKNGAYVIVGGLTEDMTDDTRSGITGLMDSPLRGLTGKDSRTRVKTTYYVAMRVTVNDPVETAAAQARAIEREAIASAPPAAPPATPTLPATTGKP